MRAASGSVPGCIHHWNDHTQLLRGLALQWSVRGGGPAARWRRMSTSVRQSFRDYLRQREASRGDEIKG